MITTVSRANLFTAINNVDSMDVVYQNIPADANNPVWVEFNSAKYIVFRDPVYYSVQLALGYTSAQMETLFNAAVAL